MNYTKEDWDYHPCLLGDESNRYNPIVTAPGINIARLFSTTATLSGMTSLAPSLAEAEANAHLIAAAPKMYEAGKRIVKWLHMIANNAEAQSRTTRFITMKEAGEKDAANYRATAKDMEQALAKAEGK